jgi:hypothetical protein
VNLVEVYCKKRKKSEIFFLHTENGGVRRSGYTYRGGYTYRAGCISEIISFYKYFLLAPDPSYRYLSRRLNGRTSPHAPPRRRERTSSSKRATSPPKATSNGLPPTPKVHMGACFSKVCFLSVLLKIRNKTHYAVYL